MKILKEYNSLLSNPDKSMGMISHLVKVNGKPKKKYQKKAILNFVDFTLQNSNKIPPVNYLGQNQKNIPH